MKKVLLLVAMKVSTLDVIRTCLAPILSDYVALCPRCVHEVSLKELQGADLVMYSHQNAKNACEELTGFSGESLICQRAIDYTRLDKVFLIPPCRDVYLINETQDTCQEVIEELRAMGITQFNLVPLYHPCNVPIDRSITTAITLGPWPHQPPHLTHVVDIGFRIVSITTFFEVILRLGLPLSLTKAIVTNYNLHIANLLRLSTQQLSQSTRDQQIAKAVLNNIESGACLLRYPDTIFMANENFYRLLLLSRQNIVEKSFREVLGANGMAVDLEAILAEDCIRANRDGADLIFSAAEIARVDRERCFLVSVSDAGTIAKKETAIRVSRRSARPQVSYRFSDYISADQRILTMLERAGRIAHKDSNVLIQGESGTGKEILAQAIHYASGRRDHPFVAINFAGMQPDLIESELFGYEEGAFTGAKKGGRRGLWEIAHGGTIFLDEVGDAPLGLQVTLLRVLQEHEIRRVGGHERVPVDVRVIAATNKDLPALVESGQFREDLFYRLNITPIDTIPLRERMGDLPILFQYFARSHFGDQTLELSSLFSPELLECLGSYGWPGNVREVSNLCEYFSCIRLGDEQLRVSDLPSYLLKRISAAEPRLSEAEVLVLRIVQRNPKIGRSRILSLLAEEGRAMTDGAIRGTLRDLADKGYLQINRTRGGCEVTARAGGLPLQP